MTNPTMHTVPTVATEKCKSDIFLIHSYTYVVPISPVPKYSGGLSLRKKCLESFKSTPSIVFGTYATGRKVRFASVRCVPCLCGEGGSRWSVATQAASVQSLCVSLPDGPLCHNDRICCFALWSIKIWEVYSSRRPIHSRERSVQFAASWGGPRSNRVWSVTIPFFLLWNSCSRG